MPNAVPTWVRAFCAREGDGWLDLEQPHTVTWRGAPAVAATNGHVLVVLAGEYEGTPFDAIGERAPAMVDAALGGAGRPVRLAALRIFAGLPPVPPATCERCESTGRLPCTECDGDGEVACECECGHEHTRDCEDCDGEGTVPCPSCSGGGRDWLDPVIPVEVAGHLFNRVSANEC